MKLNQKLWVEEARLPIRGRESGVTLIELLIGAAVGVVLVMGVMRMMGVMDIAIFDLRAQNSLTSQVLQIRSLVRSAFYYRSAMNPETGAIVVENAIETTPGANTFKVYTRYRRNPSVVGQVRFSNVCLSASGNRPAPSFTGVTCSNPLPTCTAGQRAAVAIETFENASNTSADRVTYIPALGATGKNEASGMVLCLRDASSAPPARIRLTIATERLAANGQRIWKTDFLEVWDDIDTTGVEFLR